MQLSSSSPRVSDRRLSRRSTQGGACADRRYHDRLKLDLLVNRFVNGEPYMCRMTNLSRTGARLVTIIEPDASRAPRFMGLQFQLPGRDEVLTASGETIVLQDGRSLGIRFTNLPPDAAWAIEAFLRAS